MGQVRTYDLPAPTLRLACPIHAASVFTGSRVREGNGAGEAEMVGFGSIVYFVNEHKDKMQGKRDLGTWKGNMWVKCFAYYCTSSYHTIRNSGGGRGGRCLSRPETGRHLWSRFVRWLLSMLRGGKNMRKKNRNWLEKFRFFFVFTDDNVFLRSLNLIRFSYDLIWFFILCLDMILRLCLWALDF